MDEETTWALDMQSTEHSNNLVAIIWVLLGTALFTLVFASGKLADGLAHPVQIVFLRYISGFATVCTLVACGGTGLRGYRAAKPLTHFIRAVFGCYGGVAIIYASARMPILDATAISLLYVIFIVALGVVLLKESVSSLQWVAIAVSSIGAAGVLVARGAFQSFDLSYLIPAGIAAGGAVLIACEAILIRQLSQSEKPLTVLLHVNGFGVLLVAPPAIWLWQPVEVIETMVIFTLGPIAIAAQYCIIRGYSLAQVSVLGPIDYTWLLFAGGIGYALFGETPTSGVLIGAGLIALGGAMLAFLKPG